MGRALLALVHVLVLAAPAVRAADLLGDAAAADAALEQRVRLLLVHGLGARGEALEADIGDLDRRDEGRRDAGLPRTGLADDARYLAAALALTRDAQRDALHRVLDAHPDPVVRRLAEARLASDDAAAADRLLADDRHNRRASVLNDAVRPLGIFSGAAFLAVLNPFVLAPSALDSVVTTAVNLWNYNRLSSPEREALARYNALLDRTPHTGDAPEIARAIHRLDAKRTAALCADSVDVGTRALDGGDLDAAGFYLRDAAEMDGCAEPTAKPLARLAEARAERARREEAARWPVDEPSRPASDAEARDYEALLVATALADPGAMVEAASRFREHHDDSRFAGSAGYALAVARDLAGHRDEARTALGAVAREDSSIGRHAAAVLASPDYARLDAIGEAERAHTRDRIRYVFLGGRMDGRTALYTAAQLGAQGMAAAESLGIFNVIGVVTRAWQTWWHDPASNQAIIDRGEEFLARQPDSRAASDVHARLTDAYERAGAYGRALMHYRATSDPSPKRIAKLEDEIADQLLQDAERDGGNPVLLEGIVRHFGATKAADEARTKLGKRPGDGDTVIAREVLVAYPALLGPDALDLDPRLLDGDRDNGELADGGVTLVDGGLRLTLYDDTDAGERTESHSLSPEAYARARAAAQEALYERVLMADRRAPDTGTLERYVPFFVQGQLDTSGAVSVYPAVKMRRYQTEDRSLYQ